MAFASDGGGVAAPKPSAYQAAPAPTPSTSFNPASLPDYINLPGAGFSGSTPYNSTPGGYQAALGGGFFPIPTAAQQAAGYTTDINQPTIGQPGGRNNVSMSDFLGSLATPGGGGSSLGGGASAPQYQLPDFNTLLQQQLEKLGFGQLDNGLRQQQQQLMIRYGDPGLAALAGFGLDPQSADFARQNYLSGNADLARLDTANKQAKQNIINQLASHGILFSGDTGYLTGKQEQNYGNQRYDLTNKYLDALNQAQQSVQQQKNQMRQNLVNSLLQFYSQFAANPQQLAGVFG